MVHRLNGFLDFNLNPFSMPIANMVLWAGVLAVGYGFYKGKIRL